MKIMPERRHSCSRLTLTLFFSLSDTQTTTPVCHYGPIPDGPPPKGRIERIGPVVTLICCCGIPGPQPWVPRASDAEDRESTDVSSTVNVKFPAQARCNLDTCQFLFASDTYNISNSLRALGSLLANATLEFSPLLSGNASLMSNQYRFAQSCLRHYYGWHGYVNVLCIPGAEGIVPEPNLHPLIPA